MMAGALRTVVGLGVVLGLLAVGIGLLSQGARADPPTPWPAPGDGDVSINVQTRARVVGPPTVTIDIKPCCKCNVIILHRCCCFAIVPVAILTTPDFDATTVDPDTVSFAGAQAKWSWPSDVDHDGDKDLLLIFKTRETDLAPGDTEACLDGETFDGAPIHGCDSVWIVDLGWFMAAGTVAAVVELDGGVGEDVSGGTGETAALGASSRPIAPPPAGGDGAGSWRNGWPWWVGLALGVVTGAFIVGGVGWALGAKR